MTTPEERDYIGEVIREDAAMRCAVIGVKNVNSAMSTIDELRQQLADVSHERDLLRADRDAEKAMKAKAREQRDRFMTRCVKLEGLLKSGSSPTYAHCEAVLDALLNPSAEVQS